VSRSIQRTAYHEAGHVVMAFALRRAVRHVSIVPDDSSDGRLVKHKLTDNFHPDYESDARTRRLVEREIMICLAGGVALAKFQGNRRDLGDDQDWRHAVYLADYVSSGVGGYVGDDGEATVAYLRWLQVRAKILLSLPWHWRAVEEIAQSLVERKELSGREARRIYRAALGAETRT
jgi:hypothetical protein